MKRINFQLIRLHFVYIDFNTYSVFQQSMDQDQAKLNDPHQNLEHADENVSLKTGQFFALKQKLATFESQSPKKQSTTRMIISCVAVITIVILIIAASYYYSAEIKAFNAVNFIKDIIPEKVKESFNYMKQDKKIDVRFVGNSTTESKRQKLQQIQKLKKQVQELIQKDYESEDQTEEATAITSMKQNGQSDYNSGMADYEKQKFIIPKTIWLMRQENTNRTYLDDKIQKNIQHFSDINGFEVKIIEGDNFRKYLPQDKGTNLFNYLADLEKRKQSEWSNLRDTYYIIRQRLIILTLLKYNGGIAINSKIILLQNFDWIESISTHPLINQGVGGETEVFAFHFLDLGSARLKFQKPVRHETDKYMVQFPAIQSNFIAAKAQTPFINQVLQEFVKILNEPKTLIDRIHQKKIDLNRIHFTTDPYYQSFSVACQMTLQKKQRELDDKRAAIGKGASNQKQFAIDAYGLKTMNTYYFKSKMKFFFKDGFYDKLYYNFAKYNLRELQQSVGPLRYVTEFPEHEHISYRIDQANQGNNYYQINKGSLLHQYIFLNKSTQKFVVDSKQQFRVNKYGKTWDSLPRIIWLYWGTGIEKSGIGNRLCVEKIKEMAAKSGFKVNLVDDQNLRLYLTKRDVARIDQILKASKWQTYPQTKADIIRLMLLIEHGGLYLDVSFLPLQDFDWIINISQYPSEYIFNRFGDLPKVFLLFNSHYGGDFTWWIHENANTKVSWHLGYENNLIAAEKDSYFLSDWLQELILYINTPIPKIMSQMKQLEIYEHKWVSGNIMYLAAMDAIKSKLSKKIRFLRKQLNMSIQVTDYYGLWTMSGFVGPQKFRGHTNYDGQGLPQKIIYFWQRPIKDVEAILGEVKHLIKFYHFNMEELTQFIQTNKHNITLQAHPQSFFMKHLYNEKIIFPTLNKTQSY